MNNIEELKKQFEAKIKIAELENRLEEQLNGTGCKVSIFMERDGLLYGSIRCIDSAVDRPTLEQAAGCLQKLPADHDVNVYTGSKGGYQYMPYGVKTSCGYKEQPKLEIIWVYEGMELHVYIDATLPALQGFFQIKQREISSIEQSIYCNDRGARYRDIRIPVYCFKDAGAAQTRFEGGYVTLWDEQLIYRIVDTIKAQGK